MTEPRDWPNNAAHARNQAAEHITCTIVQIDRVCAGGGLAAEAVIHLYQAQRHLLEALRWLESVGAQTRPPEL